LPSSEGGRVGVYSVEAVGGATRYARPCLPVNPLLMMEAVGMRSVRHFEQRRCEFDFELRKEVGSVGGEEDGEGAVELVDAVAELRRRRKGMLGRR
jgi:hypothetical protein